MDHLEAERMLAKIELSPGCEDHVLGKMEQRVPDM